MATRRTSLDLADTAALFEPEALTDAEGMDAATNVLAKLVKSKSKAPPDPLWGRRAAEVFRTPFPKNYKHEASRSSLFLEAGRLLLRSNQRDVVPLLIDQLFAGTDHGDTRHKFMLELVGKLGSPADVPRICQWFESQSARVIGAGSALSIHAILPNTLIRLASAETVDYVVERLHKSANGEVALTGHHSWSYEKALEVIMEGGPPNVGNSWLPEPKAAVT